MEIERNLKIPRIPEGGKYPRGLSYKFQMLQGKPWFSMHLRWGLFIARLRFWQEKLSFEAYKADYCG